ncbi:MAG: OmpA family protein [Pseudomonadota bacterium]
MAKSFMKAGVKALGGAMLAALLATTGAQAHQTTGEPFAHTHTDQQRVVTGERYVPTIWIDPDGCEHWVMDDGWEGFMSLKVDRNGKPTCRKSSICATIPGSAFEPHGVWMSRSAKAAVMDFFNKDQSAAYKIIGHTNITGNDRSNVRLSKGRANMVASIGKSAGARVVGVDGQGGRHPKVHRSSHENSRIEVICLR